MKNKKRTISKGENRGLPKVIRILFSLMAMCSIFVCNATTAQAAGSYTVDKQSVNVGDIITVTMTLDVDATGSLCYTAAEIKFNKGSLELVSATSSDYPGGTTSVEEAKDTGIITYGYKPNEFQNDITKSGTVTFQLRVLDVSKFNEIHLGQPYSKWTGNSALATSQTIGSFNLTCAHTPDTTTDDTTSISVEPTCTSNGEKKVTCSHCGAKIRSEVIPTIAHNFNDWVVLQAPTETESGSEERSCKSCGLIESRTIPKLVVQNDVTATTEISTETTAETTTEAISETPIAASKKPSSSTPTVDASPKTGDFTHPLILILLLLFSCTGMSILWKVKHENSGRK